MAVTVSTAGACRQNTLLAPTVGESAASTLRTLSPLSHAAASAPTRAPLAAVQESCAAFPVTGSSSSPRLARLELGQLPRFMRSLLLLLMAYTL